MTILITGITGMIGTHFAKAMVEKGYTTYGVARNSAACRQSIDEPNIIRCDILDYESLGNIFLRIKPEIIIHLSAQAFNGLSWEMEESTHNTNYLGTLNVLRCCKKYAQNAKILIACSSAEYGDITPEDCPLKENRLLRPITPYGVSKVATECLGYQFYKNYSIQVYLPRLFIHVGTGHPPATAIQNFAMQLALITKGKQDPVIKVGNLNTARDFIDVRDGVEGMLLLLEKGNAGEPYNICTGKAFKISDILSMLIEISGLRVEVVQDSELYRPTDEPLLLGDNSKIKKLGWSQKYTMQQTLGAIFEDWLSRV